MNAQKISLETAVMALIKISNQSTPPKFKNNQLIPERHNACAAYAQIALHEIGQLIGLEEIDAMYARWENDPEKNKP